MIPEAGVTHEIPGRMRMRIPSKRGDPSFFSALKERLSGLPGIERIETNSVTGSVLLFHRVDKDVLAAYAWDNALFEIQFRALRVAPLSEKMVRSFQQIDRRLSASTGGELDMSSLALLFLLGMGTVEIIRGNVMAPTWYTAFWYAFGLIMSARALHSTEGPRGMKPNPDV